MTDIQCLLTGVGGGIVLLFLVSKIHIVTDWLERGRGFRAEWPEPEQDRDDAEKKPNQR